MFKRRRQTQSNVRHLITQLNPRSPISEQYRTIRTNLQFSSVDEPLHSILITSAGPSAGKSITSANLAVVYAQQSMRTLLIDADMRKPTVHYTFRVDNLVGLSNVLIGDSTLENVVQKSDVEGLDLLTCGPIPPNPAELLASKRMEEVLVHAKQLYDMIIFDMPPALAVADAQIVSNLVDGVVLVYRSGETEIEAAQKVAQLFEDVKARLLGAVLNDVEREEGTYYYYYNRCVSK